MKMYTLKAINWINYRRYCESNGLADGNYKNFKKYMEDRIMLDNFKLNVIKELRDEKQKLLNENFDLQCENNVLQEKIYRRDYEIKQLQKEIENLKFRK